MSSNTVRFEESGSPRKVKPNKSLIMFQENIEDETSLQLNETINNLQQENKKLKEKVSFLSGETIGELDMNSLLDLDHKYRELLVKTSQRMKNLRESQTQANKCVVCIEGEKEIALIPCGHKVHGCVEL